MMLYVITLLFYLLQYYSPFLQWSTTWQRDDLFTYTNLSPNPINFVSPGSTGTSDIVITDSTVYQQMVGFGSALSKHTQDNQ